MLEAQLVLGIVAALTWTGVAIRILRGSVMGERGVIAGCVCIATSLVVLVCGSLYLLGIMGQTAWFVIGTGLRAVVAVTGLIALVDQSPRAKIDEYAKIADDLKVERQDQYAHLAGAIAENTLITQRASDNANAAYKEANSVNEKIATQGATIIEQGVNAAVDRETWQDTNETAHRIDERAQ